MNKPYIDLSPTEFENDLKSNPEIVLIDCRTKGEFDSGYIHGAINYDFNNGDAVQQIPKLDKDKTYYIYCRSGARSGSLCQIYADKGFKHLVNMKGGILAWTGDLE